MIAPELIEQIRDAADIVAIVGESVELKRTGSDWRGPCPFHGGTHRNFSVVPRKQMYHCFVCHESGDVFTYLMKRFGLDYPTAVREIAAKVGITVPDVRTSGPDPNEPLYSALGTAADWFARRLREADDARMARDYLDSRELDEAARDQYQLGFAPSRGEELLEALKGLGVEDDVVRKAGLVTEREDKAVVPRFRGRLIFPIADVRGRVVGFGGRLLGEGEPKYLNSPETPVFHKGTLLYALDRARTAIRTESLAVLVEGYVDAIRLQTAGIANAVAPLGTSLTPEQARLLRRYTKQVALAYDADAPGQKSSFRNADELLRQGASVSVVTLPPGEDPDTLVRRGGAEAFKVLLDAAVDVFERKIQLLDRKGLAGTLEGRRDALDRLLPTIRAAQDPITRELYVSRAAEWSGVGKEVLEQEVGRLEARTHGGTDARAHGGREGEGRPAASAPVAEIPTERTLIHLMLAVPENIARVKAELPAGEFRHPVYRALAELLYAGAGPPSEGAERETWERLASAPYERPEPEVDLVQAIAWVLDRPKGERLEEIDRLIGLAGAAEKDELLNEKRALISAGAMRFRRKALKAEREPRH
ncbi:MAG: DNA primase [Gemmatimonadales bacterium]